MKKTLTIASVFTFCALFSACSEDQIDPLTAEEAVEAYGCKLIEDPNDPTTAELRCPDGSSFTISSAEDGNDGETGNDGAPGKDGVDGMNGMDGMDGMDGSSCSVEERAQGEVAIVCDNGTEAVLVDGKPGEGSAITILTRDEPAGDNCPMGGSAMDFYQKGSTTPVYTLYQCAGGEMEKPPGCQPGYKLDVSTTRCVPTTTILFEGVVFQATSIEMGMPAAQRPSMLTTTMDDPNNPSPCSGELTYPWGEDPFRTENLPSGYRSSVYHYGDSSVYGITLTVGGQTYHREVELNDEDASQRREYTPDPDPFAPSTLTVSTNVRHLDGFDRTTHSTSLDFMAFRSVDSNVSPDSFLKLPDNAEDWSAFIPESPSFTLTSTDEVTYDSAIIGCMVTSFSSP